MPFIEINQLTGRDAETKAAIIDEVTAAYSRVTGIAPEKVWVKISETDPGDWGIGGKPLGGPTAK
ncbi:tautomerase family protein [Salininema proteolyticum]|uniref:4-oxalocrotonate tautomerase family protein n=1 Tax=Salininema proteolyticum TaxID=1607685 RepID=A0ABV8TWV2_9ACTN